MRGDAKPTGPDLERLRRIDRLFQRALEVDEDERDGWLERECPEADRAEVAVLLEALESEDTVVRPGGAIGPGTLGALQGPERGPVGRRIGRWVIVDRLGEGGNGVVYLAERADGAYRQRVAVKVLRLGSDEHTARRFTLERQLLATLDHPNVARLLDGGTTEDGEHYLVVEHVEGRRIDDHCRERELSTRQILELLCRLCGAVQAAHRRLIVHRDLKPSNILVNEQGEPKLLDFGIAKLIEGSGSFEAAPTRSLHRVMTIQYASPEQYRGDAVTVASDIYQLGLIAYELLTGSRPYSVRGEPLHSIERLITDIDPAPPSHCAREHPARARELAGDLDTILLKALRKEPEQRYHSVDELREDLERYLEGLPVRARRPSWGYLTSKFVRRNALPLGVAALVLGAIATVTVIFTLRLGAERDRTREAARQARVEQTQAEAARLEAENLVDLVVDIFGGASPALNKGRELSAAELLDRGAESLGASLETQPRARARLLATLGRMNRELGRLDVSARLQRRAIEQTEQLLGSPGALDEAERRAQTIDLADYYRNLAALLAVAGDQNGERRDLIAKAQSIVASELGPRSRESAYLMMDRARLELDHGNLEPAERIARDAVEILMVTDGPDTIETAAARRALGLALLARGELEEAEPELERSLQLFRDLRGEDSPAYATVLEPLARVASSLGRTERAGELFAECAEIMRRTLPPGHGNLVISLLNLANWLNEQERFVEAQSTIAEAGEQLEAGPERPFLEAATLDALGASQLGLGDPVAAVSSLERALELWQSTLPSGGVYLAQTENRLGEALLQVDRAEEAERMLLRSIDRLESILGDRHLLVSHAVLSLARLCESRGRLEEAAGLYQRALSIRAAVQPQDETGRREVERALATLRERRAQQMTEQPQPTRLEE